MAGLHALTAEEGFARVLPYCASPNSKDNALMFRRRVSLYHFLISMGIDLWRTLFLWKFFTSWNAIKIVSALLWIQFWTNGRCALFPFLSFVFGFPVIDPFRSAFRLPPIPKNIRTSLMGILSRPLSCVIGLCCSELCHWSCSTTYL